MSKRAPRPRPEATPAPRPRPTPAPKEDMGDRVFARMDLWPDEPRRRYYTDTGSNAILAVADALRLVRETAGLPSEHADDPAAWEEFRKALAGPVAYALELAEALARKAAIREVLVMTEAVELDLADQPNPHPPAVAS